MEKAEDFLEDLRQINELPASWVMLTCSRCTGLTIGNCWIFPSRKRWLYSPPPGNSARRLRRFIGFSTHATTDIILDAIGTDEFDYVNVALVFRQ